MTSTLTRIAVSLTLSVPEQAPYLEELLWTLEGVESVTYQLDGEEHFQGLLVIGSVPELPERIQALLNTHALETQAELSVTRQVAEEDWAESWKQYWHVSRILPHLVIQPSWESFAPHAQDIVLRLDPGSAFGTGTHETTQLMLFVLHDLLFVQRLPVNALLDVGTGSGILAIYAAKLGVPQTDAVDNDPHAVRVAQENGDQNGVRDRIRYSTASLSDLPAEGYEVVLANILANTLIAMMADLKRTVKPQGWVVMSGIARKQYQDMVEAIRANGLTLVRVFQKVEWLALVCQRKA